MHFRFCSLHVSSPCVYWLSLMFLLIFFLRNFLNLLYFSFFFEKKNSFFICSSLFVKLFLFDLLFCFTPFLVCFFQSCAFKQDNVTFFWDTKNTCLKPSKNFFSEFILTSEKKKKFFNHFSNLFFWNPFFKKKKRFSDLLRIVFLFLLFWISSFYTKIAFVTKMFLSISHFVVISWNPHALRIARSIEGSLDHCCVLWRSWAS